jgi:hypothetical protein
MPAMTIQRFRHYDSSLLAGIFCLLQMTVILAKAWTSLFTKEKCLARTQRRKWVQRGNCFVVPTRHDSNCTSLPVLSGGLAMTSQMKTTILNLLFLLPYPLKL